MEIYTSIKRSEMFRDIMFCVEKSRDQVCKVQQVKIALPEGAFSAIVGMLLVNANLKFETSTSQHNTVRLTRAGKRCTVGLPVAREGKEEWVTGGWTYLIEHWETLEEFGELSEEVHEDSACLFFYGMKVPHPLIIWGLSLS